MEPVRTHRAKTVVDAARLHRARERRSSGLTLIEGPDLIRDTVLAGAVVREIFSTDATQTHLPGAPHPTIVDERALERLAGTKSPRGPVAVVEIPVERLETSSNLLVAAGVSDPGNVGAMLRVAAAFGWGFAYTTGSADPWSPKAVRAGGGGQFQTPVSVIESVEGLSGWTTVATVVSGGDRPESVTRRPVAVLIGEEAHGLEPKLAKTAEHRVSIDMPGSTQSLNAAVASGILVFAMSQTPGQSGPRV